MHKQQRAIYFPKSEDILVDIHLCDIHADTIIVLPAIGVDISKYHTLISGLNAQGLNTISADYPGCGRNKPQVSRRFNYGYADLLRDFIPKLVQLAQEINQNTPILLGHSLGGHLATLYSQQHQIRVIGIATGNIGLQYWDFKDKVKILQAVTVFGLFIHLYGYLPGYKIGFGHKEAKGLIQDWCKIALTGKYEHITGQSEHASQNLALFIQLIGDEWAPMSSLKGLSQYFSTAQIKQFDLRSSVHGNQHSAWIKQPTLIIQCICQWIN